MKTQLTFTFDNQFEAERFLKQYNEIDVSQTFDQQETIDPTPGPVPNPLPMPPQPPQATPTLEGIPVEGLQVTDNDVEPEAVEQPDTKPITKPTTDAPTNITARAIANALRRFKDMNGHAKYKELLGYFGANAQRDIPKSEYAAVMQMIEKQSTPSIDEPVPYVPTMPVETPQAPVEPEAPLASVNDIIQALSHHKNRWGKDATKKTLERLGYPDPNNIPEEKYQWVIDELNKDDPSQTTASIDLSSF